MYHVVRIADFHVRIKQKLHSLHLPLLVQLDSTHWNASYHSIQSFRIGSYKKKANTSQVTCAVLLDFCGLSQLILKRLSNIVGYRHDHVYHYRSLPPHIIHGQ